MIVAVFCYPEVLLPAEFDPTCLRKGAQAAYLRCMEPATNTPGAQRRFDDFIGRQLRELGVRVDLSPKGSERWLKDRLQLPGIIRRYVVNYRDCWRHAVVEDSLDLAVDVHAPEVIFLMEHTNCGERFGSFQADHGFVPSPELEKSLIRQTLDDADSLLQDWHRRRGGTSRLTIVKAVGLVTPDHEACKRHLDAVVSLDEYLASDGTVHPTSAPVGLTIGAAK